MDRGAWQATVHVVTKSRTQLKRLSKHARSICKRFVKSESEICSVVSDSLRPYGLYNPWNSPGQNTGVGSFFLLQGIFPTQGLNPGLLHCRQILYQLRHREAQFVEVTRNLIVVQLLCLTPWTAAHQSPLSSTVSQNLLKFMSIESGMLSNHLILCRPLLFCLQSFPASESFPMNCLFTWGGQSIVASV